MPSRLVSKTRAYPFQQFDNLVDWYPRNEKALPGGHTGDLIRVAGGEHLSIEPESSHE